MDDQAYLQPGFDPNSLTMPRLRSILVAHNVPYPASAKKQLLVDTFNHHVRPQARSLRNASARVKRTSRGIENVPSVGGGGSSSQSTAEEDDDDEVPVPPSTGRGSRRTTRARTEEVQEVEPTPRATRHSTAPPEHTPRRSSSKHARPSEAPDTERQTKRLVSRGSRLSAATPVAKDEDEDDDDSHFSNKNVFQSGSSPPAPRTRDPERRRTAAVAAASRDRDVERRRAEVRRRTETFKPVRDQMDGAVVPTRRTFEAPVPVVRVKTEAGVEPTEEFTPEEEQELAVASQSGERVPRRPKARRPASGAAKTAPIAILGAMLVGLLGVYRQEKVEVGYCGVGRPSTEIAGVRIPEWADAIRPQCEPCPQHAYCGEKLETTCEPGFVLTPHPLSFGGVVPLAPSCEPDSAKARRVGAVKQRAVEELREQNAKYECGEATTPEVKEPDLKKAIASKRRKNMSNQEFEDLWASALGDIQSAEEVTTGADGHGHFTLRSHSLARLPLSCALRRSLREALGRYLGPIVGCLLLVAGTAYTRHHLVSTRDTDRQAADLARVALDTLRDQAAWHAFDPQTYGENFMGVAQLRDDVLRAELSAGRRARLWERVRAKVEANSNVRSLVREGKSGDVGRVWEWVGAVGGTPERGGRRVGFAGVKKEAGEGGREEGGRRWEEGRAYY